MPTRRLRIPGWRKRGVWLCAAMALGIGWFGRLPAQPGPGIERPAAPQAQRRRPPDRFRSPPAAEAAQAPPQRRTDVSLNSDTQLARAFEQLEQLIAREKWPEVTAGLQQLVEGQVAAGDTFQWGPDEQWVSAQRLAVQRILDLPLAGRRLYDNVYGPVAADLLAAARSERDLHRFADVANRFLPTAAGGAAAVEVGRAYFDRGDYSASVRWLERCSPEQRLQWPVAVQFQYALALWGVGRQADAERLAVAWAGDARLTAQWREGAKPSLAAAPARTDWPQVGGDAAHAAVAPAGAPLLIAEWSLPLTHIPAVRRQIAALTADLRDAGRACVPALQAITTGDRLALRTLRGVEVVELATGRPLWSLPPAPDSPDRLLSGILESTGDARALQQRIVGQAQYTDAGDYDQHPLTSLIFRDTVTGALSSDGRRLFALTHHAQLGRTNYGYWLGAQEEEADPFGRDWASNVLAAYDLATGAELWQVGGTRTGEPFERPLAGTYFFGPPTPADEELFLVGERDNEICLFVLEGANGRPLLTQPLANAQARVDVDGTRRLWNCQPAVASGVVVCPTTTGWTVAYDRLARRLLWAHSCTPATAVPEQQAAGGAVVQPLQPLNVRWESGPPIISGRCVLLTPPELPDAFHSQEPALVCLDLETGTELWREPKQDDGLYIGGVLDDRVVVAGRSRVRAVSLTTGDELWSLTLPIDAPPSGRGLIAGEDFLLPLADGQLWVVHVPQGQVRDRLQLPRQTEPLGNLVMSRGRLLSVDPLAVRSFAEGTALEAEIARRQLADPQDLWAAVRQAHVSVMRGDRDAAVARLEPLRTRAATAEAELREEFHTLLIDCLEQLVRSDLHARDREFQWLTELADVRANAEVRRLAIERALARRDAGAAWPLLWPSPVLTSQLPRLQLGRLEVEAAAWEAGRLADVYQLATEGVRLQMDADFAAAVEAVNTAAPDQSEVLRLERLLAFHPQGRRLTQQLAAAAEAEGDAAAAEIRWRRLRQGSDPELQRTATLRLAACLARQQAPTDAARLLAEFESQLREMPAESQTAAQTELTQLCAELKLTPSASVEPAGDWASDSFEARVERRQQQEQSPIGVLIAPAADAFYAEHRFQFHPQSQRLRVTQAAGAEWWSVPLRTPTRQMFDQTVGLRTDGLQAYAVWQGVVHALSLTDRRVRWTHPIDLRMAGVNYIRNVQAEENLVLLPTDQFTQQSGLRRYRAPTGMAAAADPGYVLLHGRRSVSLLDSLTGEVRWTRHGLPPQTMVYADADRVYGLPADGSDPFILRVVDGRELEAGPLEQHAAHAVGLQAGVLTTLQVTSRGFLGLFAPRSRLCGIDASTGAELWRHDLDSRTRIAWLDDSELVLLDLQGRLESLTASTGARRSLGQLPPDVRPDAGPVELVSDSQRLYLLFDRKWREWADHLNVANSQINGPIVCFGREGSGLLWRRSIEEQRLLRPQFEQSPVLAFFSQSSDDPLQRLRIALWDKQTGRPLLEVDDLQVSPQTYQFEFDVARKTLKWIGHTLQVEVAPRAAPPADLPSG